MTTPADEPAKTDLGDAAPAEPESAAESFDPPPVEQQREELAETVDALTKKLDVPARVNAAADETVHAVTTKAKDNQQVVIAAAAAGLAAVAAVIIIRRRKR
ncbi:DUF3618 domain-containing protein [Gordonia sp. OPL2]|uniref:DUF3618 domain-containing protein n=1 Tax=Gordonia sp. OPL2 TaxID=2486274 RepID=UPI0016567C8A|nr:DUF3618 domain-containing protein [Gordonia sp. OPL2]ROZ98779.1 DUF3618 domain-containing protein [Gordonia sp. OPL2]